MEKPAAQGSAATAGQQQQLTFKSMSPKQKFIFVCKIMVSIISFGFIFPND
jgi:hypothetical protein